MNRLIRFIFLMSLFMIVVSEMICPQLTRKAPYLIFNGNNTEMQVVWQLSSTDTCRIEWGTDTLYSLGSVQTVEYGTGHQHTYTIANLNPAEKYYYRVIVDQEIYSGTFYSASDTSAENLSFFAYGDTRTNPGIHNQVANAIASVYNADPSFQSVIISVGDLVSNGDSESLWDTEFFDPSYSGIQNMLANLPYQSCIGNHEGAGNLFRKYFPYPFVNGRYWSFDYGPAHFVVVDQYTSYGPGSAQLNWIENDLASTTKRWKFIYLHEPGWSAGDHSNNTSVQNYIQPLCIQYGVPIVFGGHNHYYARAVVNNIQHITTGGGGAPLYDPNPNYPYVVASAKAHHFCRIEIINDTLKFKAVSTSGTVIDSFTILNPLTGVKSEKGMLAGKYILNNAYPNPFNPSTTISWQSMNSQDSRQTLKIFDVLGNEIATLFNDEKPAGSYSITWNAKNLPSGIYFYQLKAGQFEETKPVVLLK